MSALAGALMLGQLVGLAPPGEPPSTVSFTDRSEFRFRSRLQGGTAIDLETTLGSALALTRPHDSLTLSYGPRLSYLDIEGDRNLTLMHAGRAEGAWWTRRLRLTITLDGSIGSQSAMGLVAPLALASAPSGAAPGATAPALPPPGVPTTTAAPTYVPQLLVLQLGSFRGAAGASYALSHRWTGGAVAYFVMAGGLDYDSQRVAAPYRNPGGEVVATYAASRRDQLASRIRSGYTWVLITGGDFLTIEATETLRHAWSPRTQSTLGAGVSFLRSQVTPAEGHTGAISGAGEASIVNTLPLEDEATIVTRLGTTLGTAYNPLLAIVQPQISALLSSAWTHHRASVTLSASALASLPFDAASASRVVTGSVVAGYTVVDPVQLQIGARAYAQVLPASAGLDYPPQWVTFLAVALQSPALEL